MTREEAIEQLQDLKCHCSDTARWIEEEPNVWMKDIEALDFAIEAVENEETILKENKALKNRCRVYSQGFLCSFCPLDCEKRAEEFRKMED